jgi:hypothetical protein
MNKIVITVEGDKLRRALLDEHPNYSLGSSRRGRPLSGAEGDILDRLRNHPFLFNKVNLELSRMQGLEAGHQRERLHHLEMQIRRSESRFLKRKLEQDMAVRIVRYKASTDGYKSQKPQLTNLQELIDPEISLLKKRARDLYESSKKFTSRTTRTERAVP